jgi:hypothetical protein
LIGQKALATNLSIQCHIKARALRVATQGPDGKWVPKLVHLNIFYISTNSKSFVLKALLKIMIFWKKILMKVMMGPLFAIRVRPLNVLIMTALSAYK